MSPTKKQNQVLEALKYLIIEKRERPTVREVGALVGLSSSTVKKHFDALEREGLISNSGKSRGIQLRDEGLAGPQGDPDQPTAERRIQVMGRIAAGHPIEAVAEATLAGEPARFPALAIDPDLFAGSGELMALRVSGDSMIEAGILDGDYVIIRRQPTVEEGEIAAVDVDGEVTLKRWQRSGDAPVNSVRLVPANARFEPIEITADDHKEVHVLGKYVGLVRGEIQL